MGARTDIWRLLIIFVAVLSMTACTGYDIDFSHQPCFPLLDFDVLRSDGFECPCQPGPDINNACLVSFGDEDQGGTLLEMGGYHYQLGLIVHHEVEAGDVLEVHDITNLSRDERRQLAAPERNEVWVTFEGPSHLSTEGRCAEGLDDDEYPRQISDLTGTITVDRFYLEPDIPYLDATFDVSSMGVVTPSTSWELAGNAQIEAGFHPDDLEPDEPETSGGGSGGSGGYDCDARCEYETELCESGNTVGCYCGAACLCECTLETGNYTGDEAQEWEDCVNDNRHNAELVYDPDSEMFSGSGHPCDQLKEH